MRVTQFGYPLENSLIEKLDLMIKRCVQKNPKKDAVLLNEGAEGEGKTSLSVAEGYYIAWRTGRKFNHNHVFSDLNQMINFLQSGEGLIAVWDEPALQALSGDALSSIVKDLKRLLMMCRNKRHFIIINMTYFNEFGSYIVWLRPLGMVHVYSRNEHEAGRFIYIRKKYLEQLWNDWKIKKKRNYSKYASHKCRGSFPDVLNPDYKYNVLSDFDFEIYEKNKNLAIASISQEKKKVSEREVRNYLILKAIENNAKLSTPLFETDLSSLFGISKRTLQRIKALARSSDIDKVTLNNNMGESEDETEKDEKEEDDKEDDDNIPRINK